MISTSQKIKFSIITCSLGDYVKLERLIKSLNRQITKNFELIIVDQGKKQLNFKTNFSFKYFRSKKIGLSLNRNIGLKLINRNTKYLMFLDDDCFLERNFFLNIEKIIKSINCKFLIFPIKNIKNKNIIIKVPKGEGLIKRKVDIIKSICSSNFVIKKNNQLFDIMLGLGSIMLSKSGEDTDYILQANKRMNFYFTNRIYVNHPNPKSNLHKSYNYGLGFSVCLMKNKEYLLLFLFIINNFINLFILKKNPSFKYKKLKLYGNLYGVYYFLKYRKKFLGR